MGERLLSWGGSAASLIPQDKPATFVSRLPNEKEGSTADSTKSEQPALPGRSKQCKSGSCARLLLDPKKIVHRYQRGHSCR